MFIDGTTIGSDGSSIVSGGSSIVGDGTFKIKTSFTKHVTGLKI